MEVSEAREEEFQYLTFGVDGGEYAIGILQVREIIGHRTPTTVPMAPDYVTGVINLRGSVVPVVDLALKFGLPGVAATKRTCIVIVDVEVGTELTMTGILVEGVHAVIDLRPDEIEPPPSFGTGAAGHYLLGMGTLGESFVPILDISRVLTEDGVLDGLAQEDGEQTPAEVDDSDSASGEASDHLAGSA